MVAQNTQRKGKNLWTAREGGSLIGYYEAPDGENEALFIADRIQRYLREAGQQEDQPRCAVLYRTNSQSRLVEEALRRYQIQYHMVGGFSFYDRAEVKDMLSYLKLVQNPHDSIALARVVNSPPRGIGKTTMETLERIALTTGMSTWDAIGRATEEKLLPPRALSALGSFRKLIEDARAMLGPGFAEKLAADVAPNAQTETEDVSFDPAEVTSVDDTSFDFAVDDEEAAPPPTFANDANSDLRHQLQLRLRLRPERGDLDNRAGERRLLSRLKPASIPSLPCCSSSLRRTRFARRIVRALTASLRLLRAKSSMPQGSQPSASPAIRRRCPS